MVIPARKYLLCFFLACTLLHVSSIAFAEGGDHLPEISEELSRTADGRIGNNREVFSRTVATPVTWLLEGPAGPDGIVRITGAFRYVASMDDGGDVFVYFFYCRRNADDELKGVKILLIRKGAEDQDSLRLRLAYDYHFFGRMEGDVPEGFIRHVGPIFSESDVDVWRVALRLPNDLRDAEIRIRAESAYYSYEIRKAILEDGFNLLRVYGD